MPVREKYGAQPPLELIRTLMGEGALYDLKDSTLKRVVSTVFIAAMGLPGGGRMPPSDRLLRHFTLVGVPEMSSETLQHVFSTILERGLCSLDPAWASQAHTIARLSVALFKRVCSALLPTPAKCHYQFNVRQLTELT
jgi:dynein heavy chain, axonemal